MADSTKHGKTGKGHRQNLKLMTTGLTKRFRENQPRIRITIEGEREDVEKVIWNMGNTPAEAAGIVVKGENKWITLIQNASKKGRFGPTMNL